MIELLQPTLSNILGFAAILTIATNNFIQLRDREAIKFLVDLDKSLTKGYVNKKGYEKVEH